MAESLPLSFTCGTNKPVLNSPVVLNMSIIYSQYIVGFILPILLPVTRLMTDTHLNFMSFKEENRLGEK